MFKSSQATTTPELVPLGVRDTVREARAGLRHISQRRDELKAELRESGEERGEGALASAARVLSRQPGRRTPEAIRSDLAALDEAERVAVQVLRQASDAAAAALRQCAAPRIQELEDRAARALAELAPIQEAARDLLFEVRAAGLGDSSRELGRLRRIVNLPTS